MDERGSIEAKNPPPKLDTPHNRGTGTYAAVRDGERERESKKKGKIIVAQRTKALNLWVPFESPLTGCVHTLKVRKLSFRFIFTSSPNVSSSLAWVRIRRDKDDDDEAFLCSRSPGGDLLLPLLGKLLLVIVNQLAILGLISLPFLFYFIFFFNAYEGWWNRMKRRPTI